MCSSNVSGISHPPQGPASPCCEYLQRGNPDLISSKCFCGQALAVGVFGGSECRGNVYGVHLSLLPTQGSQGTLLSPGLCHLPHEATALSLNGLHCLFPTDLLHRVNSAGSREVLK